VLELAQRCDVFVESFRPGALAKRGLGADALLALNPRLVYCSVSGYGQTGPLAGNAGHDVNYQARAALLSAGVGEPALGVAQLADMAGGLYAAIGILAALQARERSGRGQAVDASVWRSAMGLLTIPAARAQDQHAPVNELSGMYACYHVYRCRDGRFLSVGALEPKFWETLCEALGHSEWIPRQWEREPARSETIQMFAATFATRDRDEWIRFLRPGDCCVEPVLDPYEAVAAAREAGALVAQPCGDSSFDTVRLPVGLSATPAVAPRAAPAPGEHTDAVLAELGRSPNAIAALRASGVVA
jgi:crotonobetainyl-CoA:carnitine CoA-transferase CaiB-like acyl-CoA transferase